MLHICRIVTLILWSSTCRLVYRDRMRFPTIMR